RRPTRGYALGRAGNWTGEFCASGAVACAVANVEPARDGTEHKDAVGASFERDVGGLDEVEIVPKARPPSVGAASSATPIPWRRSSKAASRAAASPSST